MPDKNNDDYIYGFFEKVNMECWSTEKIASIGSFFFFGNAIGVFTIFLPDKVGSMKTFKFFAFPCIVLGF